MLNPYGYECNLYSPFQHYLILYLFGVIIFCIIINILQKRKDKIKKLGD